MIINNVKKESVNLWFKWCIRLFDQRHQISRRHILKPNPTNLLRSPISDLQQTISRKTDFRTFNP